MTVMGTAFRSTEEDVAFDYFLAENSCPHDF